MKRGPPTTCFRRENVMPIVQRVCVYLWPNGVLRTHAKPARDLLQACFDVEKFEICLKAMFLNGSEMGSSFV